MDQRFFSFCSAGWTSWPSYTFTPLAKAGFSAVTLAYPLLASSRMYGKVAVESALVLVCGTTPGIFATQQCVTFPYKKTGLMWVVGRVVLVHKVLGTR